MNRPKVNEALCFICQETEPQFKVMRAKESFLVCSNCKDLLVKENEMRNRIKKALVNNDRLKIFEYTLGLNPTPTRLTFEDLNKVKAEDFGTLENFKENQSK